MGGARFRSGLSRPVLRGPGPTARPAPPGGAVATGGVAELGGPGLAAGRCGPWWRAEGAGGAVPGRRVARAAAMEAMAVRGREGCGPRPGAAAAGCAPDRLPFSSQGVPVAVAVAVVTASTLLLLLLRRTGRRDGGLVTLQDPLAKYPLRLVEKEVTGAAECLNPSLGPALGGSC